MKTRSPLPSRRTCGTLDERGLKQLEKRLGGRLVIGQALRLSGDPAFERVGLVLTNPNQTQQSLKQVLQNNAPTLTLNALLKAYAKGRADQSYAETMNKVAVGLPKTVDHLMKTSVPHEVVCSACNGSKHVAEGGWVECKECSGPACPVCRGEKKFRALVPCLKCSAEGTTTAEPETERMKLALQVGGLIGTGGVTVNQTQVTLTAEQTIIQTSSQFRSATDKLLWSPSQAALPAGEPSALEQVQEAEIVAVEGGS